MWVWFWAGNCLNAITNRFRHVCYRDRKKQQFNFLVEVWTYVLYIHAGPETLSETSSADAALLGYFILASSTPVRTLGDLFEQDHCWHPQRADFKGCLSSTLLKFGTVCPKVTQMYRSSCICFFQAWLQQFTLVGLSKQIAKSSAAFFITPLREPVPCPSFSRLFCLWCTLFHPPLCSV